MEMNTLDELNAGAAAKALDDIGELIDQLAGSAREFDFNTANRMERDAAKALLIIEGAINALPGLIESARRVEEMQAALKFYADESNYIDAVAPLDLSQETRKLPARIGADGGRRAQAALSKKRTFLSPTEAAGERRVREVVPQLIDQLRDDASKMKHGPERIHVLAASNWLDSLLARTLLKGT